MGIYYNANTYYGWDEMSTYEVMENIFPCTYFYQNNIDTYDDLQTCWDFFLEDDECGDFFTFVSLYDCDDLACGISVNFEGSKQDVLSSMEDAQYIYNDFIKSAFFDTSKLPEPAFHTSTLCY